MEVDERRIRDRTPKRHLLSEEKWSEGSSWKEIVQEGKRREEEIKLEEKEIRHSC